MNESKILKYLDDTLPNLFDLEHNLQRLATKNGQKTLDYCKIELDRSKKQLDEISTGFKEMPDGFEKECQRRLLKIYHRSSMFYEKKIVDLDMMQQLSQKLENLEFDKNEIVLKATEKIILLSKLGVLEMLFAKQPFDMSVNALADILAKITGEKTTTLQPYLNAFKNDPLSHKNPLNNDKAITKVETILIAKGFHYE